MPAREDTLVQLAGAKLLTAIYAQDVLDGSDGYRPGRGALEAVRARPCDRQYGQYGSLVEADVQGFFDQMDHPWLLDMLRERIEDRALLRLIRKWLKAGILETDGQGGPSRDWRARKAGRIPRPGKRVCALRPGPVVDKGRQGPLSRRGPAVPLCR